MTAPTTLRAGDSAAWAETLPEYNASQGWGLHYRLIYPTGTPIDITAVGVGDDHTITLTATDTRTWPAGNAALVSYVKRGSGASEERITLAQQPVTILPDLTAAATLDNRTRNQRALEAAEAALEDYLASGKPHVAEYDIAGRRMKFREVKDITDLIEFYQRAVARERLASALANGGSNKVHYRG